MADAHELWVEALIDHVRGAPIDGVPVATGGFRRLKAAMSDRGLPTRNGFAACRDELVGWSCAIQKDESCVAFTAGVSSPLYATSVRLPWMM